VLRAVTEDANELTTSMIRKARDGISRRFDGACRPADTGACRQDPGHYGSTLVSRVIDAVAPRRMGGGFRWLLASSWASNLGDGIALAAGPLLVASQTSDPLLVAMAGLLQRLPWLLFGLYAGVLADRYDRRLIMVLVNLVRAAVLGALAASIAADAVSVPGVLLAMFVLGTAETFADITTGTLLPMMIDPRDLGVANARVNVGQVTLNQLVGPPLGAFLFAAGMVWPSVAQAVTCAMAAVLVARIAVGAPERRTAPSRLRAEIMEGVRWLWRHPPIRTLTLTVTFFNVTFGAAISVMVLLAEQRLDAGAVGFGLITTAGAVGGVIGSTSYGWLERHLGMANIMRCGLIVETVTHLTLANATTLNVVLAVFVVFGVHEAAWGTTVITIRQRAVPLELQGRIGSVYMMCLMGGLVVGAPIGGVLAQVWGVTAPYWFAFAGSVVILVLIWRQLDQITHT
jgi:MFS family permease